MAIKKPITKKKPREDDEEETKVLKKKKKPAPPVEDDDEDEEEEEEEEDEEVEDEDDDESDDDDEEEEEEEPAPKKKKKKPVVDDDDEDEEPTPRKGSSKPGKKKKKKSKRSLAEVFESTKPGGSLIPLGTHKAKIIGFELEGEIAEEGTTQGKLKAKITYEIIESEDDANVGKTFSNWYNIADEEGDPHQGIGFLITDLDILGFTDLSLADLEEALEDIQTDEPEVIINCKKNGTFTNVYLQGLADDDEEDD